MKYNFTLVLGLLISFIQLKAQAPQGFNYQGVARNGAGEPIGNQQVDVKISILDNLVGTTFYSETQSVTTNQFGLFTLVIGAGTAVTGTFSTLDWSTGSKYLKVEIDPTGKGNYSLSGTTQLLSVPYALYAAKSGSSGNATSQWGNDSYGIDYTNGKVAIGDATGETWFQVVKDGTGAERNFLRLHNTNNTQESNVGSYFISGTGDNAASLDITVSSKNYFPALGNGGLGSIRSEKLVLMSQTNTSSSEGYVAINTGAVWSPLTSGSERVRVTSTGNVGIGTTAPTQKLHINGKVRISDLALNTTSTKILTADTSGVLGYRNMSDFTGSFWQSNAYGIHYNGGRVGIGTSNPANPFSIEGSFTGNDRNLIQLNNTSSEQDGACGIGFAASKTGGWIQLVSSAYYPNDPNLSDYPGRLVLSCLDRGIRLEAFNANGSITFATGGDIATLVRPPVRMIVDNIGNVGIGTSTPAQKLDVNGKVRVSDLVRNDTSNKVIIADGNGVLGYRTWSSLANAQWQTNSAGINYNGGKVGIGTSEPAAPLEIKGNFKGGDRNLIALTSTNTDQDGICGIGLGVANDAGGVQMYSSAYYPNDSRLVALAGKLLVTSLSKGVRIDAWNANGEISFATGGTQSTTDISPVRMLIDHVGNVGISTLTPKTKLHVSSGDVYLDDATRGVIMKSPNGQCWRISVGNTGTLTSTSVTCP